MQSDALLTHTRALHPSSSHVPTSSTFLLVGVQKTHPPAKAFCHLQLSLDSYSRENFSNVFLKLSLVLVEKCFIGEDIKLLKQSLLP